jgi:ribonuclease P protein component
VCIVRELPQETTRAGVVASKRVGGSVQRNRAKRRLRHALREIWPTLPGTGFHIVLVATLGTGKVDYTQLLAELRRSLSELGVTQVDTSAAPKPDPDRDSGKAS